MSDYSFKATQYADAIQLDNSAINTAWVKVIVLNFGVKELLIQLSGNS